MILIVSTSKERLHDLEFVKPIEDVLSKNNIEFSTKHYLTISNTDLKEAKKVIIAGTSLQDFEYEKDLNRFEWIKDFKKPLLGICAGMQIICKLFNAKRKKKTEIGFYKEDFTREFLGLNGNEQVYHLHNNYFKLPKNFESFTDSKIPQAIKFKNIYGVLFHPEVRNKEMLLSFAKI